MTEFEKLLLEKESLVENVIDAITNSSDNASIELLAIITDILNQVSEKGKIKWNIKTVNALSNISLMLDKAFAKTDFKKLTNGFVRDFNAIVELNAGLQKSLNNIDVKTKLFYDYAEVQSEFVKTNLLKNISEVPSFGQKLKDILLNAAISNQSLSTTAKEVGEFLGTGKNANQLTKYTIQVTRDALMQFDGQLNANIAQSYGLNAIRYVGNTVKDSRPQCVRWVGMEIIPIKDLQKEINWAYRNGRGMIPNTTPANFYIYEGGFNCLHSAIPTNMKIDK